MSICNQSLRYNQPDHGISSPHPSYQRPFVCSGLTNNDTSQSSFKSKKTVPSLNFQKSSGVIKPVICKKRPFSSFSSYRSAQNRVRHVSPKRKIEDIGFPSKIIDSSDSFDDLLSRALSTPNIYTIIEGQTMMSHLQTLAQSFNFKHRAVGLLSHSHVFKELMLCFYGLKCNNVKSCIMIPEFLYRITSLTTFGNFFAPISLEGSFFKFETRCEEKHIGPASKLFSDNNGSYLQEQLASEMTQKHSTHCKADDEDESKKFLNCSLLCSDFSFDQDSDDNWYEDWIEWDNNQDAFENEPLKQFCSQKTLWDELDLFSVPDNFQFEIAVIDFKRPKKLKKLYIMSRENDKQNIAKSLLRKVHFQESFPFDGSGISTSCQTYDSNEKPSRVKAHQPERPHAFKSCLKCTERPVKSFSFKRPNSMEVNSEVYTTNGIPLLRIPSTDNMIYDELLPDEVEFANKLFVDLECFTSQVLSTIILKGAKMLNHWWKVRSKVGMHVSKCLALFLTFETIQIFCQLRRISSSSLSKLEYELQSLLVQTRLTIRLLKSLDMKLDKFNQNNVIQENTQDFTDTYTKCCEFELHIMKLPLSLKLNSFRDAEAWEFLEAFRSRSRTLSLFESANLAKKLAEAYQNMGSTVQILHAATEEFEAAIIQLQEKLNVLKKRIF